MRRLPLSFGTALSTWLLCFCCAAGQERGVVAAVDPRATQAGVNALESGGNAIDAAVAVGLTLGVVNGHNSGIGGGCFMLIHLATGENVCIDGRETAPGRATRDMFIRDGKADTRLSQIGALACGVPGELAAFDLAERRYGKKTLAALLLPAAEVAEAGIPVTAGEARLIVSQSRNIKRFPATAAILMPGGRPLRAGEILRQPDLAGTYRKIAADGIDWFYRGPFARELEDWMKANGGIMSAADLAAYQPRVRPAISTTYRGCEVVSFPPPSSGGVHVLEMLNILEHFDLAHLDSPRRLHIIAEAMKLAFADRAYWLGDPDFADVPRGLISKSYAAELARKIDTTHVIQVASHGLPPDWRTDFFKKHTTHFSTADAAGNWVACTATINTSYGSKVVIPGTGVFMNNEMDDFSIEPGVPNYFGLVGGEANCVAAGKRPLSSMSPAIVLKNGVPIIALGAAGGPKIISTVLLELVDMLDLGMTPQQAIAAPRLHQQWSPDDLYIEPNLPASDKRALARYGHHVTEIRDFSVSQIVARSTNGFTGAADPRDHGAAAIAP